MAAPKPRRYRSQSLGPRSEAVAERLAEELGLKRAAVERAALDALARDDRFREHLRAWREANQLLGDWRQTYGSRCQLQLKSGRPLRIRGQVVAGTWVQCRKVDGRCTFDLQVAVGEDGEGRSLVIEALRVADVDEVLVPIAAVDLASPVPPVREEVERPGPNGVERVVWDERGVRRTFVGDHLLPNRAVRYA